MYNYSINLSYRESDDTRYRKELLACFYMEEYGDELINRIGKLYEEVKDYYKNIITAIKPKHPLSPFKSVEDTDCFMFLFAWEYFYETHQLLVAIHNKEPDIGEKQQLLLNSVQSSTS